GINTGHVIARMFGTEVRMDYSILGEAVILAQRLESVAKAGSTYVGKRTYELTRDAFHYEALGSFELKGRPQPEPAWRVVRRRRVRIAGATGMVGRERELRIGIDLIDATAGRRCGVLAVVGEAGAGKSTLLTAVEEH